MPPHLNRRGARRYPLDVNARVGNADARTRDMSSRGLYLVMPRDLDVGSSMEVDLELPEGVPSGPLQLHLRVKVIRTEEMGDGLGVAAEIESWEVP